MPLGVILIPDVFVTAIYESKEQFVRRMLFEAALPCGFAPWNELY